MDNIINSPSVRSLNEATDEIGGYNADKWEDTRKKKNSEDDQNLKKKKVADEEYNMFQRQSEFLKKGENLKSKEILLSGSQSPQLDQNYYLIQEKLDQIQSKFGKTQEISFGRTQDISTNK